MRYRRVSGAALALAFLVVVAPAPAGAVAPPDVAPPGTYAQPAAAEFVGMMIPHHHQALIMSRMAPDRSDNGSVNALAGRIEVEQGLEIMVLQGWQGWNSLPVTDPATAYEELLGMPEMLEHMGMATPEELATLGGLEGTAFDVMFVELMIRHHEGAVHMAVDVISDTTDYFIQHLATEMLVTQQAQIARMEELLDDMT